MGTYVLKEMAKGMGKGDSALYPKLQIYNMFENDKVVKYIHEYSPAFSEGVIRGVLDALAHTMKSVLPMGHSMKIDGLGVFSLVLGFDESLPSEQQQAQGGAGEGEPRNRYRHVCIKGINFKPDPELIRRMNRNAEFERADSGVRKAQKNPFTPEERLQKAREIIRRQGQMTLGEYAAATGQDRSVASRELKRLVADPASGIAARGAHSHKVWVMREQG